MGFKVRGIALPDRVEQTFVVDGDRLRLDPGSGAELLSDGGWILPGLVDVHTHPGTESTTDTFDDEMLRRHLGEHRDAGVLLVRVPGSAARIPKWVDDEPDLPRVHSAGHWLATPGRFYAGYGRDVSEADLAKSAVEESLAATGWCKVIGDWAPTGEPVPLEKLIDTVESVHAVGGRVAVHCQTAEGCHNAVMAGADSLEHGMHLDPALLGRMAAQGTALIPTFTTFDEIVTKARAAEDDPLRDWLSEGWDGMLTTVGAAYEAGVTVLAGTDCLPFGNVATEIGWLLKAGLPAEAAVGAASWTARSWLGVPSLTEGAPADLVVYDEDPTVNPGILTRPRRIILRGQVIH